jgi:hypothetical protein
VFGFSKPANEFVNDMKKEGVTVCKCDMAFHGVFKGDETQPQNPVLKSEPKNVSSKLLPGDGGEQKSLSDKENQLDSNVSEIKKGGHMVKFTGGIEDIVVRLRDLFGDSLLKLFKVSSKSKFSKLDELIAERQNSDENINENFLFYTIVQNDFEELRERIDDPKCSTETINKLIAETNSAGGNSFNFNILYIIFYYSKYYTPRLSFRTVRHWSLACRDVS